jgi:UDP-GlcNAc:undecaprenyl-phosphate/decaprenyl-phosphate GlcNAc-1-phosphate transferase
VVVVPFLASLLTGLTIGRPALEALRRRGLVLPNHRGVAVVHPAGAVAALSSVAALLGLGALSAAGLEVLGVEAVVATAYVLAVMALGLVDDLLGGRVAGAPRGLRAHGRALLRGRPSTGVLKAAGTLALSAGAAAALGLRGAELVLAAGVLTLSVHVFNLLDLRPGRSLKALVVLAAALALGARSLAPLATIGVPFGALLALLGPDLRERGMLGDTGAGAVGAVAGLWMVLALPLSGQAVALAALAALAEDGELRSISALVERSAPLRRIDSLGRCG